MNTRKKIMSAIGILGLSASLSAAPAFVTATPTSSPVVQAMAPVETEALSFATWMDKDGKKPLTFYEGHYCKGDTDRAWPGEWVKGLMWESSLWAPETTGVYFNGIREKARGSRARCVNIWGVRNVMVIRTT